MIRTAIIATTAACATTTAADFASRVVSYDPAPGQFVANTAFNLPDRALGPPSGGGTGAPDNTDLVTLGGFGGSITLAFDQPVLDHPRNPMGLDAIVFGNAFWLANDPTRRRAECAVIEISHDTNANGLADDAWYLIPGSHIDTPLAATQAWDDDTADPAHPPASPLWLPPAHSGTWTTTTFALPASLAVTVLDNQDGPGATAEHVYAYADLSPTVTLGDTDADGTVDDAQRTPGEFFTTPDNPFTVGISPASGGGDAFDIAWAIDPDTGAPAHLTSFDFIRITTALTYDEQSLFGEFSAEIDAVSDVRPAWAADIDNSGDTDVLDLLTFLNLWFNGDADVDGDGVTSVVDLLEFLAAWFGS